MAKENLELLIAPEEIAGKLKEVAAKIDIDYQGEELTVIVVMKGALCVSADLIRYLNVPSKIEYLKASSYGQRGISRGELKITGLDAIDLEGKHVLVVDDIFDSGHTMSGLISHLQDKNPKSLKSLVLLAKNIPRTVEYRPDYTLFSIENRFVVGYGLDYKEYYRGLPGIYAFVNDVPFIATVAQ
jgi:hypoxanthine phosphoribosyltransferase